MTVGEIMEKAGKFRYSNFFFAEGETLTILDNSDKLILATALTEGFINIFWAADDKTTIITAIRDYIEQAGEESYKTKVLDAEIADSLIDLGFTEYCCFIDYWLTDLNTSYTIGENISQVLNDEYKKAADITLACEDTTRGFKRLSEEFLEEWMSSRDSIILAYKENKQMKGICLCSIYGRESEKGPVLWVRVLAVDPRWQNSGIGKSLLKSGISWGISKGAERSFLAVDSENPARHLYEKFNYLSTDEVGEINLIYKKCCPLAAD